MDDDELLGALGDALQPSLDEPDPARLAAIRAAAAARQAAASQAHVVVGLDSHRPPSSLRRFLAVAAALLAVGTLAVVLVVGRGGDQGDIEYAGAITGVAGTGELKVIKTGIGRVIELDTADLPILPKGELYEVWVVGPGDSVSTPNRISAGTFHPAPDGRSRVTFAAAFEPAKFPLLEITAEAGDGDPRPSTTVVLTAQIG